MNNSNRILDKWQERTCKSHGCTHTHTHTHTHYNLINKKENILTDVYILNLYCRNINKM